MDKMVKAGKYIIGAFVVLGVIGMFVPSSPDTASKSETKVEASKSPSSKPTKEEDSTPTLGSKVRDGKFEFVVNNIKCGIPSVTTYTTHKAMGQYCKVNISVFNIGKEPQYVDASSQKVIDSQGREFTYDFKVSDDNMWLNKLNPGLSVTGNIYFDIPVGTNIKTIELHDSMFSGGVEVRA